MAKEVHKLKLGRSNHKMTVSIDGKEIQGLTGYELRYILNPDTGLERVSINLELDLAVYSLEVES